MGMYDMEGVLEASIERRVPGHIRVIQVLLWAACVIFVIIGFFASTLWAIPTLAIIFWSWYFSNNTKITYEYEYFQGELTVDAVYHQRKRKRFAQFDLKCLEVLAREGAPELEELDRRTAGRSLSKHSLVTYDITTHNKRSENRYVMFLLEGGKYEKVFFEPTAEMLAAIRRVAPRKVYLD